MVTTFLALAVLAQGPSLYNGQPLANSGGSVVSWGGGKIEETAETSLAGGRSLKVETSNLFQGGVLKLGAPADLSVFASGNKDFLTIGLFVVDFSGASGGGGGETPNPGGAMGGGRGGGGRMGGAPAGGGGAPVGGGAAPTAVTVARMENLRLVITTTDGKLSEAMLPIRSVGKWIQAGIPVSMIPGFAKTNKTIQSIAVSGDAPTYFYLGEIKVSQDVSPIQGQIHNTALNVGRGTEVVLQATADGGTTPLVFSWDFNSTDGVQDEATGQAVRHKFRLPGTFKVTLTVKDIYGVKTPWVGTLDVTVNP
ncbi:MAG: PKD domain-containing protein [Armatimonadota bacterium]|nr:PKD domain-containing protein [Armatimonadota bacterium]